MSFSVLSLISASLLASTVFGQLSQAPSSAPACISVANSIATISPTYAAALLQNADAIGLQGECLCDLLVTQAMQGVSQEFFEKRI